MDDQILPAAVDDALAQHMKIHVFRVWNERLHDDQVFSGESVEGSNNHEACIVNEDNLIEFIEAIDVQNVVSEEEIRLIIKDSVTHQNQNEISYATLREKLYEFIVTVKKVSFKDLVHQHFNLPVDRVSRFLNMLRDEFSAGPADILKQYFLDELKYAMEKISRQELFQTTKFEALAIDKQQSSKKIASKNMLGFAVESNLKGRLSMRLPWLDEYSNIGADRGIITNLQQLDQIQSMNMSENFSEIDIENMQNVSLSLDKKTTKSIVSQNYLDKYEAILQDFGELKFNILDFERKLGDREKVLPLLTLNALDQFNLIEGKVTGWKLNHEKLSNFLQKVQMTYKSNVAYHNDLHGADVMQMCFYFLKQTRLYQTFNLSELDTLSMIIAGVCHDLGHDGYTNGYHVNTISIRAIDSNDVSAQESYHASELFRILNNDGCQFMEELSRQEYVYFRKRAIQLILATDMAHHNAKIAQMKQILQQFQFTDQNAIMEWVTDGAADQDKTDEINLNKFKNQQKIMDLLMHAADISQQCRPFECVKEWTYLLFEEFFDQGDLEIEQDLPISMLCDRANTNVAKSQPGFINFVVMPLYKIVAEILPKIGEKDNCIATLKANVEKWQQYEETEEDKKVYKQKNKNLVLIDVENEELNNDL